MNLTKSELTKIIQTMSEKDFETFSETFSENALVKKYIWCINDNTYAYVDHISDFLHSFTFGVHLLGFHYLRTAIGIMLYEPELFKGKITDLYQEVAKRYNTTWSRAERAMRHAIRRVYDMDFHQFDCFNHPWKIPELSEFLYYATDKLKKK